MTISHFSRAIDSFWYIYPYGINKNFHNFHKFSCKNVLTIRFEYIFQFFRSCPDIESICETYCTIKNSITSIHFAFTMYKVTKGIRTSSTISALLIPCKGILNFTRNTKDVGNCKWPLFFFFSFFFFFFFFGLGSYFTVKCNARFHETIPTVFVRRYKLILSRFRVATFTFKRILFQGLAKICFYQRFLESRSSLASSLQKNIERYLVPPSRPTKDARSEGKSFLCRNQHTNQICVRTYVNMYLVL